MKLSIKDRLQLLGILPAQGKYEELVIRKEIVAKIDLTGKEIEKVGLRTVGNGEKSQFVWDKDKEKDIGVDLTDVEKAYIKKALMAVNEQSQLTPDMLDLYILFTA